MNRNRRLLLAASAATVGAAASGAGPERRRVSAFGVGGTNAHVVLEEAPDAPPAVLRIIREEVKPGRQPAHEKSETGWAAALRKAGNKGYYLGMGSGNSPAGRLKCTGGESTTVQFVAFTRMAHPAESPRSR